ncbi:hypothetical protein LTR36_009532 [Oleoguttula mirabilis]|uniref:WD repeat protein mio zinc-ribbon like domain-containing protein n=1 Tax=Oleoguttula mirabilis TaxID=1507867 RepID=A0AAV9JSL7_9PEZI|nr:hypothetical protein LTR36_009532 [Oleoguttula mirabilis]
MEAAVRWSPHSTGDKQRFLIVDIADSSLTLNEVDTWSRRDLQYHAVSRFNKLPAFGAFAWSPLEESVVALGLSSGNASLIRLREDKQPSENIATFKIKQQRKCNSVAFSTQNWLAVGLDKTRSDVCLNIYDAASEHQEPVRRLCAAELVSSVRFFSSRPHELVASIQRMHIRIYDLRDGYFSGSGGNIQAATRNVNNITIDPLDENYFASGGSSGDPSVTVWDKRWIRQSSSSGSNSGAVFNFSPAVDVPAPTTVWSLRYSGQRRGRLAISSNTGEVRVIDMVEGQTSALHASEYLPTNRYGGSAWHNNRYVSQVRTVEPPWQMQRDTTDGSHRIIAFDWVGQEEAGHEQIMLALRPNREVDVLRVPTTNPLAEVTARQDLSIGFQDGSLIEAKPYAATAKPGAPYEQATGAGGAEDFGPSDYDPEASFTEGMEGAVLTCSRDSPHIGKILASATVQRERCRSGYLFDCHSNMKIVLGHWQLERLWEIINRFREHAADAGMVYKSLDLSYVGVSGLWSENIGNQCRRRLSPSRVKAAEAIHGLNTQRKIPAFAGERTNFEYHRQLCLAACGWKFTAENLEKECQELIDRGLYYQAIVQAVLHDAKHIAFNLLRTLIRSKTIPNIGLGALLASDEINDEQREMCLWMSADTEDPALKALLTFLTTGNWRDVMKTNYLHLGYRVALGLKYLNDTELSGFIQTETARAVRNGDLEGILLTGLGEGAMDLFQTYLTKSNDLQTAVLATAFTNPLYVDDVRWEMWRETYFMQMQSWRAFNERANFTVQHSRLARGHDGSTLVELPPKQVTLRCNHCQGALARDGAAAAAAANGRSNGTPVAGPAANAGTVCPHCGRHTPRCALCQLWLGTPTLVPGPPTKPPTKHTKSTSTSSKHLAPGAEDSTQLLARFLSFCVSCGHGFHAHHAKEWFSKHGMCPVPDCKCMCGLG